MNTAVSIRNTVYLFIKKRFLFDMGDDNLEDDTSLLEHGVIDSTGVLELIEFIESTYGFPMEQDELIPDNLDSIGGIVKYVSSVCPARVQVREATPEGGAASPIPGVPPGWES